MPFWQHSFKPKWAAALGRDVEGEASWENLGKRPSSATALSGAASEIGYLGGFGWLAD